MKILITSTLSNSVTIHEFNGKTVRDLQQYLIDNELFIEGMLINGNTDLNSLDNDVPTNLRVVTVTPAKSTAAIAEFNTLSYNELKAIAKQYRMEAVEKDDDLLLEIVHSRYMSVPKDVLISMLNDAYKYMNPATGTSVVSDDQLRTLEMTINELDERVFEIEYSLQLLTEVNKLRFINRLKKDYPNLVK